jgi:hypothetical protein
MNDQESDDGSDDSDLFYEFNSSDNENDNDESMEIGSHTTKSTGIAVNHSKRPLIQDITTAKKTLSNK